MKTKLLKLTCGLALLGATVAAQADSTIDFNVSLVNGNDALVTWVFGGDWTTTGAISQGYQDYPFQFNNFSMAPTGLFNVDNVVLSAPLSNAGTVTDTTTGAGVSITYLNMISMGMVQPGGPYTVNEQVNFNLDGAGLSSSSGDVIRYTPGTVNSVEFANAFSEFNAGVYSGTDPLFTTPIDITITVEPTPTPEPSTLALSVLGGLGLLWQFRRRK
ncbi:MAG: PEP-CTERM sorting domain-containing protein [Verrucomicrobiae bacterium]|nr:PEP-CTERM sorting domain-containing protein [Verrucomicrobiae bacterium]